MIRFQAARTAILGAALAVVLVVAVAIPSQAVTQTATLTSSTPSANAYFGIGVAVSEDGITALIGNSNKAVGGAAVPSTAYVFTKTGSTWAQTATLSSSDNLVGDNFGTNVALSADGLTAAVSAANKKVGTVSAAGAVYIFTRSGSTWTQQAKLTDATPTASDFYGSELSLSDDGSSLAVGAPLYGATDTGAGWFYKRTSGVWGNATKITGQAPNALSGYGVAMAGNGSAAAIGQPYYQYVSGGTTYQFPNVLTYSSINGGTTWAYKSTISTPAGLQIGSDAFGTALSLSDAGTTLLVGAPYTQYVSGTQVGGAAWVYNYAAGAWNSTPVTGLISNATANRQLGSAVSLSPDGLSAIVGMPYGDASGAAGGGVAFQWTKTTTWAYSQTYTATGTGVTDAFGSSVALDAGAGHPIIGANGHTTAGFTKAGAAYTY